MFTFIFALMLILSVVAYWAYEVRVPETAPHTSERFGVPAPRILRAISFAVATSTATFYILVFMLGKYHMFRFDTSWRAMLAYVLLDVLIVIVVLFGIKRAMSKSKMAKDAASGSAKGAASSSAKDIASDAASGSAKSSSTSTDEVKRHLPTRIVLSILGGVVLLLIAVGFLVPTWFRGYFGTVTGDQFLFLIGNGGGEATAEVDAQIANLMVVPCVLAGLVGLQLGVWARKTKGLWITFVAGVVVLAIAVVYAFRMLPLQDAIVANTNKSDYIATHYVDSEQTVKFPEQKRNVIHIYMESMENSYYDKAHGGYGDDDLMPDLLQYNEANTHFSNTDTMGGPHQVFGSSHSIAAIVNMESGVPMANFYAFKGDGDDTVDAPQPTIGDLTEAEGYNNEIMMCADASWGSFDKWWHDHGNYKIFDHQYAVDNGYIPPDYRVWWGFEDDKLYEYAKEELNDLSSQDKPFNLILENADTHFPDGYKSENMTEEPYDSQYANVIHYSQGQIAQFLEWCQQQPWYENTTIVVTGDHRSMDKNFFDGWDPNYERTIVNFYLNPAVPMPDEQHMQNRDFAPYDLFPTTLRAMGCTIEGDRAGLGTDLFSDTPTNIETEGLDEVNTELSKVQEGTPGA